MSHSLYIFLSLSSSCPLFASSFSHFISLFLFTYLAISPSFLPYFIIHSTLYSLYSFYLLFISLFLFSSCFAHPISPPFSTLTKRKENFSYKCIRKLWRDQVSSHLFFFMQCALSDSFYLSSSPLSYFPTLSSPPSSTLWPLLCISYSLALYPGCKNIIHLIPPFLNILFTALPPTREYLIIYRGPSFLAVLWFSSMPSLPASTSPGSKLSLFVNLSVCRRSSLQTGDGGRGRAWSRIIRLQESYCKLGPL